MENQPNNITDLREQLLEAFAWVKTDPRRANQVKEMTNAAGKIIGTLKTELEYCILRGEIPDIAFMGKTSGKPLPLGAKMLRSS
jgi:hypothetical protein